MGFPVPFTSRSIVYLGTWKPSFLLCESRTQKGRHSQVVVVGKTVCLLASLKM